MPNLNLLVLALTPTDEHHALMRAHLERSAAVLTVLAFSSDIDPKDLRHGEDLVDLDLAVARDPNARARELNERIHAARAKWPIDYVAILADDTFVDDHWVATAIDLARRGLGWACRQVYHSNRALDPRQSLRIGSRPERPYRVPSGVVGGACWGFPIAAYDAIGGFDLAYDGTLEACEQDAVIRMERAGCAFHTTSSASVVCRRAVQQRQTFVVSEHFKPDRRAPKPTALITAVRAERARILPVFAYVPACAKHGPYDAASCPLCRVGIELPNVTHAPGGAFPAPPRITPVAPPAADGIATSPISKRDVTRIMAAHVAPDVPAETWAAAAAAHAAAKTKAELRAFLARMAEHAAAGLSPNEALEATNAEIVATGGTPVEWGPTGHQLDAPGGPVCRCGQRSTHESGWCGDCVGTPELDPTDDAPPEADGIATSPKD